MDRHNVTVHQPADRPDVEVHIQGRGWVTGEVRMQWQHGDGSWWAEVQYRSTKHNSTEIDAFPADRVRRDDTDHSHGRT
jgi:expansin (peptidoglycan-binding protein)